MPDQTNSDAEIIAAETAPPKKYEAPAKPAKPAKRLLDPSKPMWRVITPELHGAVVAILDELPNKIVSDVFLSFKNAPIHQNE